MKKLSSVLLLMLILFFGSCIPSLHSIVTNTTRYFQNDIVGEWVESKELEVNYDIKISSDDDEADLDSLNKEFSDLFGSFKQDISWKFHRAATISLEGELDLKELEGVDIKDNKMTITMSPVPYDFDISTLPHKNLKVISKEELPYYLVQNDKNSPSWLMSDEEESKYLKMEMTEINGNVYMDFSPTNTDIVSKMYGSVFSPNFIGAHTFARVDFTEDSLTVRQFNSEYITKMIKEKRIRLKHEIINGYDKNVLNDKVVLTASTEELRAFIAKYGNDEEIYNEPMVLRKKPKI